jgi:hypothetical protein
LNTPSYIFLHCISFCHTQQHYMRHEPAATAAA